MSSGKNGWNPFDWNAFEQFLGGVQPLRPDGKGNGWVEDFVQGMLKQSLPQHFAGNHSPFRPETFETLNHVIVKFAVPEGINPKSIRVQASINQLRLEFSDGRAQTVTLPALIRTDSTRATCKDGILQIKMPKRKSARHWEDVYIRHL